MTPRRPRGSGSLSIRTQRDGTKVYYGKFRDERTGQQINRRVGLVRTAHRADGLTQSQAERRLRELMQEVQASAPIAHARTLGVAADAWLQHNGAPPFRWTGVD